MNYQFRAGTAASSKTCPGHSGHHGVSASPLPLAGALPSCKLSRGELQPVHAGARRRAEVGTRAGGVCPAWGGEGTPATAGASPGSAAALPSGL